MLSEADLPPIDATAPEMSGLDRDLVAFYGLWDAATPTLQAAVDGGNAGYSALVDVVQDFYIRTYDHAVGAALLLHDARPIPFLVVRRALYETVVTLNYLATHPESEREAQIALLHQPYHEIWSYKKYGLLEGDVARLNAARERIAALAFDADIVEAARAREAKYRWTGKNFQQLFESRGNPHEYRFIYGRMSAVVHPDQRQIAQHMSSLPREWFEGRASECRYFLRETQRLVSLALGIPFSSEWLPTPIAS
jgi:Family of unknown function (DUF5677)